MRDISGTVVLAFLGLQTGLLISALSFLHNAQADIAYVKAHPVVETHILWRTRVVYKRADDVNAILVKAGRYCRDHGGVGFVNLFPEVPENWGVACNWKDAYFSDTGLKLETTTP